MQKLSMRILDEEYGVCRLKPDSEVPTWAGNGEFTSITRTSDELSIVCSEKNMPEEIICERNWKIIKIEGPLDFTMIGVLAQISMILAKEKISIFVISTFDTDYILVKEKDLSLTKITLTQDGYKFQNSSNE